MTDTQVSAPNSAGGSRRSGLFSLSTSIKDKDWDSIFVVNQKCFAELPEIEALSPGGLHPVNRATSVEGLRRGLFGGPIERAYAKVTETQSDRITSFLTAIVYRGPKGIVDGPLVEPPPPVQLPFIQDKEDRAFLEWYWTRLKDLTRRSVDLQVPHTFVQALGTDPDFQHQGAASMLMEWIVSFTAENKLRRCALQSGPSTVGFYEKFGFRVVDTCTFMDEKRFPGRVGTAVMTMVKDLE